MRSIAIIGAGQAGLLLALSLLGRGYRVTLVADRTAEEIRHGQVAAGQVVFADALAIERSLGVNFWDGIAVPSEAMHLDLVGPDGQLALSIESALVPPALVVDPRLKCYRWMNEVARRGGEIIIKPATIEDLEGYARTHDLVVVAAGKGALASLFVRDPERSPHQEAPRSVSMVILNGLRKWSNFQRPGPKFNIVPGIGELFSAPIFAKDEMQGCFLGFEAIPGGPMDRVKPGMSAEEQLQISKQIYKDYLPWDYEMVAAGTLTDSRACLLGKIVPTVKKPVATLPSGAVVLGLADTVVVHDPIVAQGANNANKAAHCLARRIVERGAEPFDAPWMNDVFEEIWSEARYAHALADKFLLPPEPHMVEVMIAAAQNPVVAHRFLNDFARPKDLVPWLLDPVASRQYLQSVSAP